MCTSAIPGRQQPVFQCTGKCRRPCAGATFTIDGSSPLSDLQERFTAIYPFLKLHLLRNGSAGKNIPALLIDPGTTVAELIAAFARFGVTAVVSRRSGSAWIETLLTSDWTLAYQSQEAMAFDGMG